MEFAMVKVEIQTYKMTYQEILDKYKFVVGQVYVKHEMHSGSTWLMFLKNNRSFGQRIEALPSTIKTIK